MLLDRQYTDYCAGRRIVITTDIPCHLWLWLTDQTPTKRRLTRRVRGVVIPCGHTWRLKAKWNFEQEELGDTTVHTFYIENFPQNEFLWYTLEGFIANKASVSSGPLLYLRAPFSKRITTWSGYRETNPYPPPPSHTEVVMAWYPGNVDGIWITAKALVQGPPQWWGWAPLLDVALNASTYFVASLTLPLHTYCVPGPFLPGDQIDIRIYHGIYPAAWTAYGTFRTYVP